MARPHVVIVGGGFGGLWAARALAEAPVRVTVVDRRNHHLFQPLLYQVATAGLNPSDIAAPIRSVLRTQANAAVLLAEVARVDAPGRRLLLADGGELAYDYLILAAGAINSYFGHDDWAAFAPGLKTLEDATEIRARLLYAFEAAEREDDAEARRAWLTFVVVGGGATGVELAGAVSEIAKKTVARDFRRIDPTEARVVLVEGGPRLVAAFSESLSASARAQLTGLGVEVRTGVQVSRIDGGGVTFAPPGGAAETLVARTVLWGAGVRASPLAATLGAPCNRAGRVQVTPSLRVPGHEELFVIGDMAAVACDAKPVPGVCPAAMQMGEYVAGVIRHRVEDGEAGEPEPFDYFDKGSMATIGRSRAVAVLPGGLELSGFLAWAAWLFVHILYLIGFRNRLLVMIEWAWAYVTFQRGARLITHESSRQLGDKKPGDKKPDAKQSPTT